VTRLRVLLVLLVVAALVACGSSRVASPSDDTSDAGSDASANDAASELDANRPTLPYPAGPYGGAIGDTLPDFTVLGYAMSPTQRDSTKLPFGPISLSQVRSARDCACMVILFNAAGYGCSWCGIEEETLGASVVEDPSMCVFEVLGFNFDTSGGTVPQPTTRADLDQRTQTAQQPFPVGIATDSARAALSATAFTAVPENLVVRASDMKLVGFIDGVGSKIPDQAHALCATPHPSIETIATGLDARHIAVDTSSLYIADATHGFLVQDLTKSPLTPPVVVDPRAADALDADGAAVYYAAANADGTFAIVRYTKADGTRTDLVTTQSRFLALFVDKGTSATAQSSIFFARADGVVGSMPKTGGAVTTLATGETLAPAIAAGPSYAFFISTATNEVVRVSRTTMTREVIVKPSWPMTASPMTSATVVPKDLVASTEGVMFTGVESFPGDPIQGGALYAIPADPSQSPNALAGSAMPMGVARDADEAILLSFRSEWLATPTGILGRHDTTQFWTTTTPGVPDARAVAGDGKMIYFTTDETAPGASDGTVRRIPR
jgi:hypothetical protein